jgi:WD40 repeat protein
VSDLDTLARAATRELLDTGIPDVPARYAELKRIRSRRTTVKAATAAAAVLLAVGGWQLREPGQERSVQPVAPTPHVHNGAVLGIHDVGADGSEGWATAYGDVNDHLPTDAGTEPLMQFSPDGRTLYYSDDRGRLATWDLATGTKAVLMDCPERGCAGGSISPDGRTGLFLGSGHLVVADLTTGTTGSLAVPLTDAGPMAWSPDGGRLAFMSLGSLWTMRPDATAPATVHQDGHVSSDPPFSVAWSPDGGRIAFFEVSQVAPGDPAHKYTLMVVDADGSHPVRVREVGTGAGDHAPLPSVAWSPDGQELAVATADLGDDTGVHTVRPDGSDWTLRMKGYWSWLTWQPLAD